MELDVLLFQETGSWVAQCLQYDIAAPGRKIDDAIYELQRIICGQIVVRKELNLPPIEQALPRAPEIYWKLYHQAARIEKNPPRIEMQSGICVDMNREEFRVAA